ncbi:hypothetical protein Tco_0480418 [Tanacetum coccineum]
MKKYDYGHLEEIEVRQDDQKLYTFKEGDFKRLRLQDIEDKLLLLVQQKLTNLTIDKRYDLNVALLFSTRRIVIHECLFKRKRLMRTDELHKFSDGTLNDVRSALHDIVAVSHPVSGGNTRMRRYHSSYKIQDHTLYNLQ